MTDAPDLEPTALEAAVKEFSRWYKSRTGAEWHILREADDGSSEITCSLSSDQSEAVLENRSVAAAIRAYLAARSTVPEAGKAVDARSVIHRVLCDYRLSNFVFEGEGDPYCLVDMVTPDGRGINEGEDELFLLADEIAAALPLPSPTGGVDELTAAVEAGIAFGYDPATGFVHADDGGAPAGCIFYEPKSAFASFPDPTGAEPVAWPVGEAEVCIYDPRGDYLAKREPHKVIAASLHFMDNAKVGDQLYSEAQVREIIAFATQPQEGK